MKQSHEKKMNNHLYVVPDLEVVPPNEEAQISLSNSEPELPETITLRLDKRAVHQLIALALYDHVSPAQELRTALTLYLASRMGSTAVKDFITKSEREMLETYDTLATACETTDTNVLSGE